MNSDICEKLIKIGNYLNDAQKWGVFTRTLIDTDKEDLCPYFARKSGSAYLKADSLYNQILGLGNGIFYFEGAGDGPDGWYFIDETEQANGPYDSSSLASKALDEYCKMYL